MNDWMRAMLEQEKKNAEYRKAIEKRLARAPEGDLRVVTSRGIARFYHTKVPGAKDTYLNKDQLALRTVLAQKKYELLALEALEREQKAIDFVRRLSPPSLLEVYESLPEEVRALVEPYVLPDEVFIRRWLEYYSSDASGEDYKSRIEWNIHQYYEGLGAPHVYEPFLMLKDYGPARPDFVVLNVRTRQTFYHEHFGMMGDPEYRAKNMRKLCGYHKSGYFEGKNLIITMEEGGDMIDYHELGQVLRAYCL